MKGFTGQSLRKGCGTAVSQRRDREEGREEERSETLETEETSTEIVCFCGDLRRLFGDGGTRVELLDNLEIVFLSDLLDESVDLQQQDVKIETRQQNER